VELHVELPFSGLPQVKGAKKTRENLARSFSMLNPDAPASGRD